MLSDYQITSIKFSIRNELYIVNCNNVLYLQADDHYTQVYYPSGAHFMIPFGLSHVMEKVCLVLSEDPFLKRVSRKFVVNVRAIFHINTMKEVVLLSDAHGGNHEIHVPKKTLQDLMLLIQQR